MACTCGVLGETMVPGGGVVSGAPGTPKLTVGVDTVGVTDVLASLRTFGERYLNRVFTAHEQSSCCGPDEVRARGLAARFAAKEATVKALRAHDLAGAWTAIEVRRDPAGWAGIALHGAAAEHARRRGICDLSLSMTHDASLATAIVVAIADSVSPSASFTSTGPGDRAATPNAGVLETGADAPGGDAPCPSR